MIAFLMEPDEEKGLSWLIMLQRFAYRQIMYSVVLKSFLAAIRGRVVGGVARTKGHGGASGVTGTPMKAIATGEDARHCGRTHGLRDRARGRCGTNCALYDFRRVREDLQNVRAAISGVQSASPRAAISR